MAEAVFTALDRRSLREDRADIVYTQIGSLAGPTAAVPSSLLRGRRIRIVGSGAGSISTAALLAELPGLMELIANGRIAVPYASYPLEKVGAAWRHAGPERAVIVPA
ncbi:MAG: hypothetical protein ACOYEV_01475 [Candidatus Nanopelagicales bacterium]